LERVLYKNFPLAKVPALLHGFEGAKEGCTYHFDDKVPAPTIKREIMFIRDTSYGVSSHFPSCGSHWTEHRLLQGGCKSVHMTDLRRGAHAREGGRAYQRCQWCQRWAWGL